MRHKMGLNPSPYDRRTLKLADYRTGEKITIPDHFGVGTWVPPDGWGMLANGPDPTVDPHFVGCGDCFWAGRAHGTWAVEMVQHQTALRSPFTSHDVLRGYSGGAGYVYSTDPNNPTDQGTDPISGLNYCRKHGIMSSGAGLPKTHKIGGYAQIESGNWSTILEAAWSFGTVGLGFQIPDYAEDEFDRRRKWSVHSGGQIEGGHWVEGVMYDHISGFHLVTWGSLIAVTKGFIEKYCDAPYAILSTELLDPLTGKSPQGFDLAALERDLAAL